jgi:hypothetical protein
MFEILKKLFKKNKEQIPEPVKYDMTILDIEDKEEREKFIQKANDYGYFRMGANEYYRYLQFSKNHKNCRVDETGKHKFGTIGGGVEVSFENTGLGPIITCRCKACGETVDITDSDCW